MRPAAHGLQLAERAGRELSIAGAHVFVTGGSGFVGSHVARSLVSRGARVRCLVRSNSAVDRLRALGVELVEGDLRDGAAVSRAVTGAELVFHCAADYRLHASDPAELYATNVDGTNHVMRAAFDRGVRRVVHTSSVATLVPAPDGTPVDERARGTLDQMIGDYERSKLLGQRAAEEWAARGLPVVIVSPATPVGEGDGKPTPTGQILVEFLRRRMPATVDTGLNLVDVHDVAAGHLLAAERGRPGDNYILGHRNLTLRQILELVARISGQAPPRFQIPVWIPLALAHVEARLARRTGRAPRIPLDGVRMSRRKMFFDARKAMVELGWCPCPGGIEPALERAVRWFVARGLAPRPGASC